MGPIGIELAILGLKGTNEVLRRIRRDERPDGHFLLALQKRIAVLQRGVQNLAVGIERMLEGASADSRGRLRR